MLRSGAEILNSDVKTGFALSESATMGKIRSGGI